MENNLNQSLSHADMMVLVNTLMNRLDQPQLAIAPNDVGLLIDRLGLIPNTGPTVNVAVFLARGELARGLTRDAAFRICQAASRYLGSSSY